MDIKDLLSSASSTTIAISGLLILFGVVLIRLGRRDWHKKVMIGACVLAAIFVALYVLRASLFPVEKYAGPHRAIYLKILWSHTVLSVVNLPMAIVTVCLALKGNFERHRKVAPFTAALWIYVAASGWLIHFMNA